MAYLPETAGADAPQRRGDLAHMRAALALAGRGLGRVWPNPAVGCVLVREGEDPGGRDDRVVARGWTQPGGRPHAETEALHRAGDAARGATAYLTLEPCAHHGKTPPCADALIEAGIRRAVVAIEDPDPRVAGRGLERMRAQGIAVTTGLCAAEAEELNAGFLSRIGRRRPLVTLKLATTLDGRIATHAGESQWITEAPARQRGHLLRATHDAVLVGTGTVLADDPQLTCRLAGLQESSPVRIMLDRRLRSPLTAKLVAGARSVPTWLVTLEGGDAARRQAFADSGVEVIEIPPDDGNLPLPAVFEALGDRGLTRVLAEAGSHLAAALLRAGLVDRIAWFRGPSVIGGDGLPAAVAFGVDRLADAPRFVRTGLAAAGQDLLETYRRDS